MTCATEATQVVAQTAYDGACAQLELIEVARQNGLMTDEDADRFRARAEESIERVSGDLPTNGGGTPRHLRVVEPG